MRGPDQGRAARPAASPEEYERRLRSAMRLISAKTRESVVHEIRAGIEAQVKIANGDFAKVAPTLDDPKWVGRQMVVVYGVAAPYKVLGLVLVGLLAAASVPGLLLQPGDSGPAIVLSLAGFLVAVMLVFWASFAFSWKLGLAAAGLAFAIRVGGLFVPQSAEGSLIDLSTQGEAVLFVLTSAMLLVVPLVLAAVRRMRGDEEA